MRIALCVIAALAVLGASAAEPSPDPVSPDPNNEVHIALTVLQPASLGRIRTSALAKTSVPKPGESLQVRVAATKPCHAIVVGFNAAHQIAWPDQPALVMLAAGDQRLIPESGWKWESADVVDELDILVVDNQAPALPDLTRLIEAMRAPAAPAVRTRQTAELRRMMDALTQRDTSNAQYTLKTDPVLLGGLLRGDVCEWCKDAWKISLPASGSYLVRQRFPL